MALGTVTSSWYSVANNGQQSCTPGNVQHAFGSIAIPANTSFATTDVLKLFQFPGPASYFLGFEIDFPALDGGNGLTFKMIDTLASATTFFTGNTTARAGGWVTTSSASTAKMMNAVNSGNGYVAGIEIQLVPSAASTNTTGASALAIYFDAWYKNA